MPKKSTSQCTLTDLTRSGQMESKTDSGRKTNIVIAKFIEENTRRSQKKKVLSLEVTVRIKTISKNKIRIKTGLALGLPVNSSAVNSTGIWTQTVLVATG